MENTIAILGRLDTGKMTIRGVVARKGDTPDYVRQIQQELFYALATARSLDELIPTTVLPDPVARTIMPRLPLAVMHQGPGSGNLSKQRCFEVQDRVGD